MVSVDALYCIIVSWTDGLLAGTLPSLSLISPPLLPPSSHVFFPCLSLISSFLVCCPLVTQHGSCKACREYSCTSKNTRAPDLTLQALWTTQEKQPFMPIKSTLERDNVQLQKKKKKSTLITSLTYSGGRNKDVQIQTVFTDRLWWGLSISWLPTCCPRDIDWESYNERGLYSSSATATSSYFDALG